MCRYLILEVIPRRTGISEELGNRVVGKNQPNGVFLSSFPLWAFGIGYRWEPLQRYVEAPLHRRPKAGKREHLPTGFRASICRDNNDLVGTQGLYTTPNISMVPPKISKSLWQECPLRGKARESGCS